MIDSYSIDGVEGLPNTFRVEVRGREDAAMNCLCLSSAMCSAKASKLGLVFQQTPVLSHGAFGEQGVYSVTYTISDRSKTAALMGQVQDVMDMVLVKGAGLFCFSNTTIEKLGGLMIVDYMKDLDLKVSALCDLYSVLFKHVMDGMRIVAIKDNYIYPVTEVSELAKGKKS